MRFGGRDKQQQERDEKKGRRDDSGTEHEAGKQDDQLKTEIQAIIRDELKMIVDGEASGHNSTRDRDQQRFQIRKPIKVGERSSSRHGGKGSQQPRDPAIRHDIELLTQVQMELSSELAENLKQLKSVIAESQALAERIQAVLGQNKQQN